jgi:NhaP-type Na+/H+ or K+/H+ antiporter
MRKFYGAIFVLWIALIVVLGFVRIVGKLKLPSGDIALLHLTDCTPPCWIGIVPGKTTIEEAEALLSATYRHEVDMNIGINYRD